MSALIRLLAGLAATVSLSACSLPYYWQAVGGQVELLAKRKPLERAFEQESLDPEVRRVLSRVPEILEFADERLELPNDGSYRSYVDLGRPYAIWNVVATEEFSTKPVRWCFPFSGCVAYRGYFDRSNAVDFRLRLEADGFDTFVGGATAYSTLGYFNDPVLSTMLVGGTDTLAALLFHELAHQKLYVKGDSELNEAYATVIEEHGMTLWLTEHESSAALDAYLRKRRRREEFSELVLHQQQRLEQIYRSPADAATKRRKKREAFDRLRAEYADLKVRWGTGDYDAWFDAELNNARLAAVATYRRWLPALRSRLNEIGIEAFHAEMARIAELERGERDELLASWLPRPIKGT